MQKNTTTLFLFCKQNIEFCHFDNEHVHYSNIVYILGMGHDFWIFYLIIEYRLGCAIIF